MILISTLYLFIPHSGNLSDTVNSVITIDVIVLVPETAAGAGGQTLEATITDSGVEVTDSFSYTPAAAVNLIDPVSMYPSLLLLFLFVHLLLNRCKEFESPLFISVPFSLISEDLSVTLANDRCMFSIHYHSNEWVSRHFISRTFGLTTLAASL